MKNMLVGVKQTHSKTREQILSQEVLTNADIQILLGIKHTKANDVMKVIRSVSDIIHISGIVHVKDYFAYINRFDKKEGQAK